MTHDWTIKHYRCSICRIEVSYTQYANMHMVESGMCFEHYYATYGTIDP